MMNWLNVQVKNIQVGEVLPGSDCREEGCSVER